MSFTSRWLKRRAVNKIVFNYPRKVTPKYVAKSLVLSKGLSELLKKR